MTLASNPDRKNSYWATLNADSAYGWLHGGHIAEDLPSLPNNKKLHRLT